MGLFSFDETKYGFEPVIEFYTRKLLTNVRSPEKSMASYPQRRTGKTTTLVLKAIDLVLLGEQVVILVKNRNSKNIIKNLYVNMWKKIVGTNVNLDNLTFVSFHEAVPWESYSGQILIEDFAFLTGNFNGTFSFETRNEYVSDFKDFEEFLRNKN